MNRREAMIDLPKKIVKNRYESDIINTGISKPIPARKGEK